MKLIHITEAADRIGVSRQTLKNWCDNGTIPSHKMGRTEGSTRSVWVDSDTIDALADTMRDVERARNILKKEAARFESQEELFYDMADEIEREVFLIGKVGSAVRRKEFYLSIPKMLASIGTITDREADIMCQVIDGREIMLIALDYGLTKTRVLQIFLKGCKKAAELKDIKSELDELKRLRVEVAELKTVIKNLSKDEQNNNHGQIDDSFRNKVHRRLVDCGLSTRTLGCLVGAGIYTVADLCKWNKLDLLHIRNFGKKSLAELDDFLEEMGLYFGMDVDKMILNDILYEI